MLLHKEHMACLETCMPRWWQNRATSNLLRVGIHQTNLLNSPTATLSGTEGRGGYPSLGGKEEGLLL